jgi:hypothetical protein
MVLPVPARPGGRLARRWNTYQNSSTPQAAYTETTTVPLYRQGQGKVSGSGTATVSMGPAGTGTKWYPQTATFSTSSGGPASGCYVAIYTDIVSQSTLLNGALYNGPGDSAGLAVPFVTPGNTLVAEWVGATPGDIVQLTISGTQDVLVTA